MHLHADAVFFFVSWRLFLRKYEKNRKRRYLVKKCKSILFTFYLQDKGKGKYELDFSKQG